MKILVADDSKTTLVLITETVKQMGHEINGASSGAEAIRLFEKERPDLIILDVVMEGMNGYECAKRIRELSAEDWIPIIFLSSSIDDQSIALGIESGGDDYLTKPVSEVILAAKITAMQRISAMRKRLYETTKKLEILSSTDPLTGVYNRFQFEKSLTEKLAEADRHQDLLALLFIDIDHFKSVNDSLGHHKGDLLLQQIAHRIRDCLRTEDFLARIGGDEFVVIISRLQDEHAGGKLAQKIVTALMPVFNLENSSVRVSASIGVATYPMVGSDKETLVRNADMAMYHAKELGRNNFQYFTEALADKYREQISLEHELKFALERGELSIVYQPIFHLVTKKLMGVEALLRWHHPEYGLISPNVFIPIAEETGVILEIGTWVFTKVCEQVGKWYAAGYRNFLVTVNVSLHQFLQEKFYEFVVGTLKEYNVPPNALELELTETTAVTYTAHLKKTTKQLHELGIGISIDDFGSRYSSLTSLRLLPITTLKIDKQFMQDLATDPKNSIIIKSLIALGSSLGLSVIAEGIQTEEHLQFLVINGCQFGQGFLLSKPLKAEEFEKFLQLNFINQSKAK